MPNRKWLWGVVMALVPIALKRTISTVQKVVVSQINYMPEKPVALSVASVMAIAWRCVNSMPSILMKKQACRLWMTTNVLLVEHVLKYVLSTSSNYEIKALKIVEFSFLASIKIKVVWLEKLVALPVSVAVNALKFVRLVLLPSKITSLISILIFVASAVSASLNALQVLSMM